MPTTEPVVQDPLDVIPTVEITIEELQAGIAFSELLVRGKLCKSKSEARRLMRQGGLYIWRNAEWERMVNNEEKRMSSKENR